MKTYQISAPHFVAGIEVEGDVVYRFAPIVAYMRGWTLDKVTAYCAKKRWAIKEIEQ